MSFKPNFYFCENKILLGVFSGYHICSRLMFDVGILYINSLVCLHCKTALKIAVIIHCREIPFRTKKKIRNYAIEFLKFFLELKFFFGGLII